MAQIDGVAFLPGKIFFWRARHGSDPKFRRNPEQREPDIVTAFSFNNKIKKSESLRKGTLTKKSNFYF